MVGREWEAKLRKWRAMLIRHSLGAGRVGGEGERDRSSDPRNKDIWVEWVEWGVQFVVKDGRMVPPYMV
jgi:hypothetical protein